MAKGNLFLGTAARSVGDVVMYRREGSQVSRVRVRKVANPRTDAQSLQRAAFSPVAKFFSPLAVVLERAWEGVSKSKSYSEFLKKNVKKARTNGWLLPKGTGFFPLPYQLTEGSLPQFMYNLGNDFEWNIPGVDVDDKSTDDIDNVLKEFGYQKGDVITLIYITGSIAKGFVPHSAQHVINNAVSAPIAKMFGNGVDVAAKDGELMITSSLGQPIVAAAVIVARFENDKWRRSTQSLSVASSILTEIGTDAYKAAAVASYGNTAGDINPLVYLDGKDLEG